MSPLGIPIGAFVLQAGHGDSVLGLENTVVALLAIAALVAILVRRVRVPYTVALVLVGLGLALFADFRVEISSDLILGVLVPPLVFEATMHLPWRRLRADLPSILSLAVIGTLVGTFLVGAIVRAFVDVPWAAALAFGALISATDPVAVIALFRTLGVSSRLTTLVEGESLFNDGTAIVIFTVAASAATGTDFEVGDAAWEFVKVSFGGLAVGLVLGYVVSNVVLRNLDDHLIETAVTVALAFGSFLAAEEMGAIVGVDGLHLSGILSVVAAGLMVGNIGLQNTSPPTRLTLENFWEFLSFVVNSFVFLLIGLEIAIGDLRDNLGVILAAVAAILLSRAVIVYGTMAVHNRIEATSFVPAGFQHTLYWGGLRGAVSLALALTLSEHFDEPTTEVLQVMTFGVVLFTLLVQGTTIKVLIARLGLSHHSTAVSDQQLQQAKIYSKRAGRRELDRLHEEGLVVQEVWAPLDELYGEELAVDRAALGRHLEAQPGLETEMFLQVRADALAAERSAVFDAARHGLISTEIAEESARELAYRLAALDFLRNHVDAGEETGEHDGGHG